MKEKFEPVEMEIITFEADDIIVTSNPDCPFETPPI